MKVIATLMRFSEATRSKLTVIPNSGIIRTEKSKAPNADPSRSELYNLAALTVTWSFKMADPSENCIPVTTDIIRVSKINIECSSIPGIKNLFNSIITSGRREAYIIIISCKNMKLFIDVLMIFSLYNAPKASPPIKTVMIIPV